MCVRVATLTNPEVSRKSRYMYILYLCADVIHNLQKKVRAHVHVHVIVHGLSFRVIIRFMAYIHMYD